MASVAARSAPIDIGTAGPVGAPVLRFIGTRQMRTRPPRSLRKWMNSPSEDQTGLQSIAPGGVMLTGLRPSIVIVQMPPSRRGRVTAGVCAADQYAMRFPSGDTAGWR